MQSTCAVFELNLNHSGAAKMLNRVCSFVDSDTVCFRSDVISSQFVLLSFLSLIMAPALA